MGLELWWVKCLIAVALVSSLIGGFEWWKHHIEAAADARGYARANSEWLVKEESIRVDAEAKFAKASKDAKDVEVALHDKFDALSVVRLKEKTDHDKVVAGYIAHASAERLSIATREAGSAVSGAASPTNTTTGGSVSTETRTDILPETASAILGIASDTADLVQDYNEVVDRYNNVRAVCNSP